MNMSMRKERILQSAITTVCMEVRRDWPENLNVDPVLERILTEGRKISEKFFNDCVNENLDALEVAIRRVKRRHKYEEITCELIIENIMTFRSVLPGFDFSYWEGMAGMVSTKKDIRVLDHNLIDSVEKEYVRRMTKWECDLINKLREVIFQDLKDWIEAIKTFAVMGNSFEGIGLLWDLSPETMSRADVQTVIKYAKLIDEDENLKKLCDMLGRMATARKKVERKKVLASEAVHVMLPNTSSREEVVGITFGCSIVDAVPGELAMLGDPVTEQLFDLKFAEERLMQFEKIGLEGVELKRDVEKEVAEEIQERGPVVICVDTSGSMSGMPEVVAKAVALTLAVKAHKEKRRCFLVSFGISCTTYDFTAESGLEGLFRFLQLSFGGGTDFGPALQVCLNRMKSDEYHLADLLLVSDFMVDGIAKEIQTQIQQMRNLGNKFNALTISDSSLSCLNRQADSTLFDNVIIFNPSDSRSASEFVWTLW